MIDEYNYNAEDWFADIPDLVNKTETEFWFKMSRGFLVGIKRGLMNDNHETLPPECFGPYYAQKMNEYAYLFWGNPFGDAWKNMFPVLALTYEFYYMIWTECEVDKNANEVAL